MVYTPYFAAGYTFLIFALASLVSARRMSLGISLGDGDNKQMRNAIRAHANALEHILPYLILLFFFELKGGGKMLTLIMGGGFGLARLLHAFGMLKHVMPARRISAGLTYLFQLTLVGLTCWKLLG